MDLQGMLPAASTVLSVLLGALALWLRGSQRLFALAVRLIAEAEEAYRDSTRAGGEKFEWVVTSLYRALPAALRPFVPRTAVEAVVQSTFDAVEGYAKLQLERSGAAVQAAGDPPGDARQTDSEQGGGEDG